MSSDPTIDTTCVVVYQDVATESVYTRLLVDFTDGRFTPVAEMPCSCDPPVFSYEHHSWSHMVWKGLCDKCGMRADYEWDYSTSPARKVSPS